MHYHDKDGNPLINTVVFPDLGGMAKHAHSLNLTSGWYCVLELAHTAIQCRNSRAVTVFVASLRDCL